MRSHSVLYVDAGYLLAGTATRLTGSSFRRGIAVDYATLLGHLAEVVEKRSDLPLLRVYWYDAAREGVPHPAHDEISQLPRVKLRLGRIGVDGEQKGVDLRIGLDMVGHSRNGAAEVMYLLSGDDDLTEAVEEAQALGVQVVLLAVPTRTGTPHAVSKHLIAAADGIQTLSADELDGSVTVARPAQEERPATTPSAPGAPRPAAPRTPLVASPLRRASLPPSVSADRDTDDDAAVAAVIEDVAIKTYEAWAISAPQEQLQTYSR